MIVIKSNASTVGDVVLRDIGVIIPAGGGQETFDENDDLDLIQNSKYLRELTTDDAFGLGSSTLILNDGSSDIAQSEVLDYIDGIGRGSVGGIDSVEHKGLDTLAHNVAESSEAVFSRDAYRRVISVVTYDPTETFKIRESLYTYIGLSRRVDTITTIQYDAAGVEIERVTSTASYDGLRIMRVSSVRTP